MPLCTYVFAMMINFICVRIVVCIIICSVLKNNTTICFLLALSVPHNIHSPPVLRKKVISRARQVTVHH